ncbi:MAG: FAD-binding oxidoreductase, partial [Sediminibacterium sp.]
MANVGLITPFIAAQLKSIVGAHFYLADEENLQHYGHDETERLLYLPEVVLKPADTDEIAAILRICHEHKI